MRRGFYFVLMVVLVLRGLAGTAMATGALPPLSGGAAHGQAQVQKHGHHPASDPTHTAAKVALAPHLQTMPHVPHVPAHGEHSGTQTPDVSSLGHGQVVDGGHAHAAQATLPACDGSAASCAAHEHHAAACSACDICHSAMLHAPATLAPALGGTGSTLPMASAQFDSAPAALAIKPPIA